MAEKSKYINYRRGLMAELMDTKDETTHRISILEFVITIKRKSFDSVIDSYSKLSLDAIDMVLEQLAENRGYHVDILHVSRFAIRLKEHLKEQKIKELEAEIRRLRNG